MAQTDGKFADRNRDFYLKEYESLREEIEWLLQEYSSLERNVVIAVGVTWGFLVKEHANAPKWAWFIACLFAALGYFRAWSIIKLFGHFHEYIGSLESAFSGADGPGGWEHFLHGKTWNQTSQHTFWIILIVATIGVACAALLSR
jgi:hypothetical protein